MVYGVSPGQTDTWWWSHIAQTILNAEAESQEDKKLEDRICIHSQYLENDHIWLGMRDETANAEGRKTD